MIKDLIELKKILPIFDVMHDGIMVIDTDYKIQYYNQAMEKIEGFEAGEVIGKTITDVFPSQTYEKNSIMQAIQEGKQSNEMIQTYTTCKKREITVVTSTIPIKSDETIIGALEITKDISNAKVLMDKIIDLQDKLHKAESGNAFKNGHTKNCHYTFDQILGTSLAIKKIITYAMKASATPSTVMVSGETGTGKELIVQSIHNSSNRRHKPFVAINCAALPGELLEGILFGTVKGSFTGSIDRAGLFEQAHEGTLLLDEVDSMDVRLQAKLLRVLQEGRIRRVGGMSSKKIDVRIISTSNSNLHEAMNNKTFRRDLYYRLSVVNINVPPLRERENDILILSEYFIQEYNNLFNKEVQGLSSQVKALFEWYQWPGNIRELRHCIEGIMNIIDEARPILVQDLPARIVEGLKMEVVTSSNLEENDADCDRRSLDDLTTSIEKDSIINALLTAKGNVSKAADILGIKRQSLQYKMKKYHVSKDKFTLVLDEKNLRE